MNKKQEIEEAFMDYAEDSLILAKLAEHGELVSTVDIDMDDWPVEDTHSRTDLKERLEVEGLGKNHNPVICVSGGVVRFWSDEELVFAITEQEFGEFVDLWLDARMEERFGPVGDG